MIAALPSFADSFVSLAFDDFKSHFHTENFFLVSSYHGFNALFVHPFMRSQPTFVLVARVFALSSALSILFVDARMRRAKYPRNCTMGGLGYVKDEAKRGAPLFYLRISNV